MKEEKLLITFQDEIENQSGVCACCKHSNPEYLDYYKGTKNLRGVVCADCKLYLISDIENGSDGFWALWVSDYVKTGICSPPSFEESTI